MDGPPAWRFGEGLTTPHHKKLLVMKCYTGRHTWVESLAGFCEHCNVPLGSIKSGEFLN
jgi:hypothetical protein